VWILEGWRLAPRHERSGGAPAAGYAAQALIDTEACGSTNDWVPPRVVSSSFHLGFYAY